MSKFPIGTQNRDFFAGDLPLPLFSALIKKLKPHVERSHIPVLNCITIKMSANTCTVSHHGLDRDIVTTFETDAPGSGQVVIPLSRLSAFLAAATGPTLTIRKAKEDGSVALTAGRLNASIVPLSVSDLPDRFDLNGLNPVRAFDFGEGVLTHLLDFVSPCVSTEETRYYLNGVCLELLDGEVLGVATDGHRLATRSFKTVAPLEAWDRKPIIPRETISAVRKLAAKAEGRIEFFEKSPDAAAFFVLKADDWTIKSRTIDGTFPTWRRVCPDGAVTFVEISTLDINRFAAVANAGGGSPFQRTALSVEAAEGGIKFGYTVEGTDTFTSFIDAKVTGEPLRRFGVKISYLAALASIFKSKTLKLHCIDPGSAIRITAPESPENEFAILMPMRI